MNTRSCGFMSSSKTFTLTGAALLMTLALGGPHVSLAEPIGLTEEAAASEPLMIGSPEAQQKYIRDLLIPFADTSNSSFNEEVHVEKRAWSAAFMLFSLDPGWANLCIDGTQNPVRLDYCAVGDTRFAFQYDPGSRLIQNRNNWKCLAFSDDWNSIYPADCNGWDNRQRWFYSREYVNQLEENKWKVFDYNNWRTCMDKRDGFHLSQLRVTDCYDNNWSADKNKRFEIIRYSEQFGPTFIIRNRVDGKCVTAGNLDQPLALIACDGRSTQYFRWNPKSWLVKSEHWAGQGKSYCIQREGIDVDMRLRTCNGALNTQKLFAFDGLIRSAQDDWKYCLGRKAGSANANIRYCWISPNDDVRFSFASQSTDRILRKRQLTLKISTITFTEKFAFW